MAAFAYTIRDSSGRSSSGTLAADNAAEASATLRGQGAILLRLRPVPERRNTAPTRRTPWSALRCQPKSAPVEVSLKQIAVMLRSGLTLLETLRTVSEQSTSGRMRRTWDEVASAVRGGATLTSAMMSLNRFDRIVTELVQVGEQTGQLDVVLDRAADALERRRLLKAQMVSALLYPTIVLLAAVGVTVFILTYAIPRLTVYLKALGRPLPAMTQILVDVSDFLLTQWPVLLGPTVLGIVLFSVAYSAPIGRLAVDTVLLRIPLMGYILRTGATAALSRSLSLLLASGVSIVEALRTCQELHANRRLALILARSRERVMAGDPIAPTVKLPGGFMPMLASMVDAGERSGQLDRTLLECAVYHEQRLEALIRVLSSVIEIIVVVTVGGIVGYVYVAFMLALYGAAL